MVSLYEEKRKKSLILREKEGQGASTHWYCILKVISLLLWPKMDAALLACIPTIG